MYAMKNSDDRVLSGDQRLCSPLVTISLPSVSSKHHENLHSRKRPKQYRRESNITSPKESACASLLFHGEVCLLLLRLFSTEFSTSCSPLYDRGGLLLSLAVHWYHLLYTIVIHRIRPSHAQSYSLAMPTVRSALPMNTDTLRPLTTNVVPRPSACPTLVGEFSKCIHTYSTWRVKKELYASLDTGEVCLPSYACSVHRALALMAAWLIHARAYKGRRPNPNAEHRTLYLLPELLDSLPRLHFDALSAPRVRPRPDLRASLAFHSEVCFIGFWHTPPHGQLFASHRHSLQHENWVRKTSIID